jgi:hypothetical protein
MQAAASSRLVLAVSVSVSSDLRIMNTSKNAVAQRQMSRTMSSSSDEVVCSARMSWAGGKTAQMMFGIKIRMKLTQPTAENPIV